MENFTLIPEEFSFSTIINKLHNPYVPKGNKENHADFITLILESFYFSPSSNKLPGNRTLEYYFSGHRDLPKSIRNFYINSIENQNALKNTILKKLVPNINDVDSVILNLINILEADNYFSPLEKNTILLNPKYQSSDEKSTLLTQMLLLSFKREKSEIVTSQTKKSPALKQILRNSPPPPSTYFTGRVDELNQLHKRLIKHKRILITGPAGIGKSELVLKYIDNNRGLFSNIVYWEYSGDLKNDITNLYFENDENMLNRNAQFSNHEFILKKLDSDSLIIVDNFNASEHDDKYLHTLMQIGRAHV